MRPPLIHLRAFSVFSARVSSVVALVSRPVLARSLAARSLTSARCSSSAVMALVLNVASLRIARIVADSLAKVRGILEDRRKTLVAMAGLNIPNAAVRKYVSSAIDIIIQVARLVDGSRKVVSFQEVTGMESGIIMLQELFTFEQTGIDTNGAVKGQFRSLGIMPGFISRFKAMGVPIPYEMFDGKRAHSKA